MEALFNIKTIERSSSPVSSLTSEFEILLQGNPASEPPSDNEQSKVQRCLFSSTLLRRTQSFDLSKIRKQEEQTMQIRRGKRIMCIHSSTDSDPSTLPEVLNEESTILPYNEEEEDEEESVNSGVSRSMTSETVTNTSNSTSSNEDKIVEAVTTPTITIRRPLFLVTKSTGSLPSSPVFQKTTYFVTPLKTPPVSFVSPSNISFTEPSSMTFTSTTSTSYTPTSTNYTSTSTGTTYTSTTYNSSSFLSKSDSQIVDISSQSSEPLGSPPPPLSYSSEIPLLLPSIEAKKSLPYISPLILSKLIMKTPEYSHINFTIIDCRYEFEFNGGHIRGAHNIKTPQELENKYLRTPDYRPNDVLIFHCEFSSYRGPNLCELLRNRDRQIHQENYPLLYYPQLYVLKDGYKSFFENFPELCDPTAYIPMLDPRFKDELKQYKSLLRSDSSMKVKRSFSTGDLKMSSRKRNFD